MPRIKFPSTDIRTRKEKNNTPENRSPQEKSQNSYKELEQYKQQQVQVQKKGQ